MPRERLVMSDLLIELFSEEIPARMQEIAAQQLKNKMVLYLAEEGLSEISATAFSTPRRLTLFVNGIPEKSPDTREERKGPRIDAPQKAIDGFLRSVDLELDQLQIRNDGKVDKYFALIETSGRASEEIIEKALEKTIKTFPWPKSMRWGSSSLRWVRPLQGILCILTKDDEQRLIDFEIEGIKSKSVTTGHRFMAPEYFNVKDFEDYKRKLRDAFVILDHSERSEIILNDANNLAFANGLDLIDDPALLAEVSGLVEWPVVLLGDVDTAFFELPAEVLQASMKEHQKFFSLKNPKTGKIEKFITVANIETADNGATILEGNQKVLYARLSDAKFFWENDLRLIQKDGLSAWSEKLKNVMFHNKLGSQGDKVLRISALSQKLAKRLECDVETARIGAEICKCDLASEMVYEFPELQGVMGRYYASSAGYSENVAKICEQHYAPRGPNDPVPSTLTSIVVSLADKLDTLLSFWIINEKPSSSKDPFALRRSALGVIRIILENDLELDLAELLDNHLENVSIFGSDRDAVPDLMNFIRDRFKIYLRDKNIRYDVIDACLDVGKIGNLSLIQKRINALTNLFQSEDAEDFLQGFKRANNILAKAEQKDGVEYSFGADVKYMEDVSERELLDALTKQHSTVKTAVSVEDFQKAILAISDLRKPIDFFFNSIQVNSENDIVRRNRLNLLGQIRETCNLVADLSKIEGQSS